jgi:hypothetical protein
MKLLSNFFLRVGIAVMVLQLMACQKILEYMPEIKAAKHYRLKKMILRTEYTEYEGRFYYNKWGDPDSVIFGFVATGHANLYLKYNNKRQLIEARGLYSNGLYEDWHRYGYTGNQVTTDTCYTWGDASRDPEPGNYYYKRINRFEYDSYGRISTETWDYIYPESETQVWAFQYDEKGNRIKPYQGLEYDNHINIHQLHPVWQFLARDYSVNNPIPAVSYNTAGLPLRFDQPIKYPLRYYFINQGRYLEQASIEYEVKK